MYKSYNKSENKEIKHHQCHKTSRLIRQFLFTDTSKSASIFKVKETETRNCQTRTLY
uniref:Uncharacterized protein n=1 Tax=Arion vulgaris TaxID=1028688 RepID=A0A0B7AKP3_9EUPU